MRELLDSLLELDPALVGEHLHATDAGRRELLEALAYIRANAGDLFGGYPASPDNPMRADPSTGATSTPRLRIRAPEGSMFLLEFDGKVAAQRSLEKVNARVLFFIITSCRSGLHALDLETLVDGGELGDLSMDTGACFELAKRLGVELSLIGPPSPAIGALLRRLEFLETTPVHPWRQVKKGSTRWTVEKEQTLVRAALSDRVYTPQHEREDPVMRSKKRLRRASDTAARTLKESAPAAAAYYKGCVSWDDTIVFTDPN